MSYPSPEERLQIYREVEKRVRLRINRRKEFFSHLVAFLVTMIGMWALWSVPGGDAASVYHTIVILTTIGWGMGIMIHATQFLFDEWGERVIDHELEKAGVYRHDKSKRDENDYDLRRERLGADGEVFETKSEDDSEEQYRGQAH